jgi:arginyl-tRNA--protein-N-Asp/Glu arginylyltransferase
LVFALLNTGETLNKPSRTRSCKPACCKIVYAETADTAKNAYAAHHSERKVIKKIIIEAAAYQAEYQILEENHYFVFRKNILEPESSRKSARVRLR